MSTRYRAYIGWAGRDAGVFRVGVSTVAPAVDTLGYDRIGYSFTPSYTGLYDEITQEEIYMATDFTITRGRESPFSNMVAGTCVVNLSDKWPGRYNPKNTASPLTGLIRPMRPCKVQGSWDDGVTWEDLFHGWLEEGSSDPEMGNNKATFSFKDLFIWLDQNPGEMVIATTGPIYVGEVIGLILDLIGWTNPVMRSLANGTLLNDFSADGTKSGLELIGEILQIDL